MRSILSFGGLSSAEVESVLKHSAKDEVVMRCLSAQRGVEITDTVIEGNRPVVWQQGENKPYGGQGHSSLS
jgi:ornithine carbamoyltransferase